MAAMSIILIVSLLKTVAACVACCAKYRDVTGFAEDRYSAKMSGSSLLVLSKLTSEILTLEAHSSDFCSAAPILCPVEAQYSRDTS